ncbi:MAG: hypothetical protein AB4426_27275 [Xenococcaceae cyanobacterium]
MLSHVKQIAIDLHLPRELTLSELVNGDRLTAGFYKDRGVEQV